jgi:hypothetical protein
MEHTVVAGAPEQASNTEPLKEVPETKLRRYEAVPPGAMVSEGLALGATEREK